MECLHSKLTTAVLPPGLMIHSLQWLVAMRTCLLDDSGVNIKTASLSTCALYGSLSVPLYDGNISSEAP